MEVDEWIEALGPIIYYADVFKDVQLNVLSKRQNNKVYAYCDAMIGTGELEMIICVTDGCIVCSDADSFDHVSDWSEKILGVVRSLGVRMGWYAKYYMEKRKGNWPMKMPLDERLTDGFIEAYIPSLDTAAYLRSIDHHFSSVEKATIIGNHECLSREEKLEALQRMKQLTKDDEELCKSLEVAMKLIRENEYWYDHFSAWVVFHEWILIPHDLRHGDIVRLAGSEDGSVLGVILGFDEEVYERYCNFLGDYSDVQVAVSTRFSMKGGDHKGNPIYEYMGEFAHQHTNPIYIERARLGHENECRWYLEYLASCDTANEQEYRSLAQKVIMKQLEFVWAQYPELGLMELMAAAAKVGTLWLKFPQMSIQEILGLPQAAEIDIIKVKDKVVMDGLYRLQKAKEKNNE